MDERGAILSNERIASTVEDLDRFLDGFEEASSVLESAGIWELVHETIERHGFEVVLAHPLKVRAIAEAKVKTDKVDARTLAHLLRADLVPRWYIPSRDIRDLRQLVRQRAYLVQRATSFKNRVHAELLRRGVKRPKELVKPFTKKSVRWMRSLGIPTVDSSLDCLEAIHQQVERLNDQLLREFDRRREARLIATIPGIGYYGALLIWAEIADVR
jgi:transposase